MFDADVDRMEVDRCVADENSDPNVAPPVVTPEGHVDKRRRQSAARKRTRTCQTRPRQLQTGPASTWTSATGRRAVSSAVLRCGSSWCRRSRPGRDGRGRWTSRAGSSSTRVDVRRQVVPPQDQSVRESRKRSVGRDRRWKDSAPGVRIVHGHSRLQRQAPGRHRCQIGLRDGSGTRTAIDATGPWTPTDAQRPVRLSCIPHARAGNRAR